MIPWDGDEMHQGPEGCWGDRDGKDCGAAVSTPAGLCQFCHALLISRSA